MFPTLEDHQTWLTRLVEIYDSMYPDNQPFAPKISSHLSVTPIGTNCQDDIKPDEPYFIFEAEAEECMQYFIKNQALHYPLNLQEMKQQL